MQYDAVGDNKQFFVPRSEKGLPKLFVHADLKGAILKL